MANRATVTHVIFDMDGLLLGASRLIRHLHEKGIPVCGGCNRDPEVKLGKPAPDVFLAAAKRFEGDPVDPESVLVFEDAPAGVNAGKNAGMLVNNTHVVMVPDPRLDISLHEGRSGGQIPVGFLSSPFEREES